MGWVAPLVPVADSAVDCGSVGSSTARWSHTASGLYHGVSSLVTFLWQPFCYGGMGSLLCGHCRWCSFYRTFLIVSEKFVLFVCLTCMHFLCAACPCVFVVYMPKGV